MLPHLCGGDVPLVRPGPAQHALVEHPYPALAEGAHGEFRLPRGPQLPYETDVERGAEGVGDLRRHRHAAARETEDHDVLVLEVAEAGGELPARVGAIAEVHDPPPFRMRGSGHGARPCAPASLPVPPG